MENNKFRSPDFLLNGTFQNEENISKLVVEVKRCLDSNGIDIKTRHYKNDIAYKKIRNDWIDGFPGGAMSLEEFIDRFMRNNYTFDSIYDMGNPNEIEEELCTNSAVAEEIWNALYSGSYEKTKEDVCNELKRKNGLIERIKNTWGLT